MVEGALQACIQASVMALFVFVSRALLASRITPRLISLLWIPVVARLLVLIEFPVPTLEVNPPIGQMEFAAGGIQMISASQAISTLFAAPESLGIAGARGLRLVWLGGALVSLCPVSIVYARQLLALRHAPRPQSPKAAEWLARHRLNRSLRLFESGAVRTPIACGVVRPSIYVPIGFFDQPDAHIEAVLEHEFAHIRRFDTLTRPLSLVAACLFWFNPLFWAAYRIQAADQELACDASAISRLGEGFRETYALALLDAAEMSMGLGTAGAPAFRRGPLGKRIMRIIHPVGRISAWSAAAVAAIASLSIVAAGMACAVTETRVGLGNCSFSLPSHWNNRVEVSADSDRLVVHLPGRPDLYLLVLDMNARDPSPLYGESLELLWSGKDREGSSYELWGMCYAVVAVSDVWRAWPVSNPSYPGPDVEAEAVDLSTGGAMSAEQAHAAKNIEGPEAWAFLRGIAATAEIC